MNKQEFIINLRKKLVGLPEREVEERLCFYEEMIDDRIEEGFSESDAVFAIGSIDEIAAQIVSDIPLSKIAKEKIKPQRRFNRWEILLIALGSPLWLSLILSAFAVVFSLYAVIWSVAVSLWAVFISVIGAALGAILGGVGFMCVGNISGLALFGVGIFSAGLSILLFYGSKAATKGILLLTGKIIYCIKICFIKRGKTNE